MHPLIPKFLRLANLTLTTILLPTLALAQTTHPTAPCKPLITTPNQKPIPCGTKRHIDTSISLGILPQLTIDRAYDNGNGLGLQSTAPSTGTLGSFRQTFHSWLGYSVNLGYSRVSEQYRTSPSDYVSNINFNIDTNVYESSVTYVAHTPVNRHYSLFADIGPGLLTFLPIHRGSDAVLYAPGHNALLVPSVQVRPAGVGGFGLDFPLTPSFALRVEYRALYYKNPDFNTGDGPYSKALTLTSEPTLSLVYHFHQRKP
jgi:opacity protein-like surface antigen